MIIMQEHFLFDDDDPKQRGYGCDALRPKDERLKFKWQWIQQRRLCGRKGKDRKPCQCSEAVLKDGWVLETTFWHTEYEAEVNRHGERVVSYCIRHDEVTKAEPALITRIDAQLKAEQLFEEIGINILEQIDRHSTNPMPLSYMEYKDSIQRIQGKAT